MIETVPYERVQPPAPSGQGGDEGEPYCYCCMVGTCQHRIVDGHLISAVTSLQGTMLCISCAQHLRNYPPARL